MSRNETLDEMIRELQVMLDRYKLVFVHAGCLQSQARDFLTSSDLFSVWPYDSFLSEDVSLPDLHLVDISDHQGRLESLDLGSLRSKVEAILDGDGRVALLSRSPRVSYVPVPGSNLLYDARLFNSVPLDFALDQTIRDDAAKWGVAVSAIRELGGLVLAALERAIFELDLGDRNLESALQDREFEAIRSVGLIAPKPSQGAAGDAIFESPLGIRVLKKLVSEATFGQVSPPLEFGEACQMMWEIENNIRRGVRSAAISKWGDDWKSSLAPGGLMDEIVIRANQSGYLSASKIGQLRDPLEWTTFSELLDLRENRSLGGLFLRDHMWRQLRSDVSPIRNRIAHMRSLRVTDMPVLMKWHTLVTNRSRDYFK